MIEVPALGEAGLGRHEGRSVATEALPPDDFANGNVHRNDKRPRGGPRTGDSRA